MEKANKNSIFEIKVISNGPYLSSKYLKICNNTKISIIWKKWSNGHFKNKIWINEYITNDLGVFDINKNSILNIDEKYNQNHEVPRKLTINNDIITNNGTSSDIYIIKFLEECDYMIFYDSFIDK